MPLATHSYTTVPWALELNGVDAGAPNAVKGGEAYGDVIDETVGPDLVVRKHIGGVRYSDIEIECGAGMTSDVYTWIANMLARKAPRKSGAVVSFDSGGTERQRLAFSNGLITEVGFPALDSASKDAAHIKLKITPEETQRPPASGTSTTVPLPKGKQWFRSQFRLTIDGLDCSGVSRIEPLVARQALVESPAGAGALRDYIQEPSALDVGDLVVTLRESQAQDWYAWQDELVPAQRQLGRVLDRDRPLLATDVGRRGNLGPAFERTGKLQFLAPNARDAIFELGFKGLGIYRLAAEQEAATQGISVVRASMYCEELTFAVPAPSTSATGATAANGGNGAASRAETVAGLTRSPPETLLPAREGASRIRPTSGAPSPGPGPAPVPSVALVSFALNPDTVGRMRFVRGTQDDPVFTGGGDVSFEVGLDGPAPPGGVQVDILRDGAVFFQIVVAEGVTTGAQTVSFAPEDVPRLGDYAFEARLGDVTKTAVLHAR
jgi:hypothetical protein